MTKLRAHLFVSGYVQGVGFRYYTHQAARREGVTGWVRNLSDGRVEATVEGEAEAVHRVVAWCRHGPPGADVTAVEVEWPAATGEFGEFTIR